MSRQTEEIAELLLDAARVLAAVRAAGVSIAKFQTMLEQSPDGHLTPEQLDELAQDAHAAVGRLG
jgi:hypothetical protein